MMTYMSGPIKKTGFSNIPLYGTMRATYLLSGMNYSKADDIAKFLWDGLLDAEKKTDNQIYEYIYKGFCDMDVFEDGRFNEDREIIKTKNELYARTCVGKESFLISGFLDTKKNLVIDGLNVKYTQVFEVPGTVAKIRRNSEEETIFTINPWQEGIPFDPTFLYQAGEKFGKLVKS